MNPLLQAFQTPFQTPPFSLIKEIHFLPALQDALTKGREDVAKICSNTDSATFKNTIEALEYAGEQVGVISEIFFNLNSAETNDEIQEIARDFSPLLAEYGNDIMLNADLFKRVKAVYDNASGLNDEEQMLLTKTYRAFARNGANLSEEEKEEIREIDKQLSGLSLGFGENVLAETNAFELHLTNADDLDGLPDYVVEAAAELATDTGRDGAWVFNLQYPSYIPFVTYSAKRALREKMNRAFGSRANAANDRNNSSNVLQIAKLRQQRAAILGFNSHADYVLQERMAEKPETVSNFLANILESAKPAGESEVQNLANFAQQLDGLDHLEKWDFAYYSEKLKQQKFEIDDDALKPYFSLDKVVTGAFAVAERLYGLKFTELSTIDKYHPDVQTFEVKDGNGNHLSVLYADFFPRKGKRNGAWMTSFRSQKVKNGKNIRPLISIVCNFSKPTQSKPSLLTFQEVLTLFHEFGHALHGMLANGTYASLSGTSVYWDFVELPSQILENWCYEKECLDLFAHHYETGEKIPDDMVKRLKESATFMEGYATVRQVGLATLDMAWHTGKAENGESINDFETEVLASTELLPKVSGSNTSTAFSHIFQGGYSAGYYSYKWAEVLDADAFELFLEKGIFNTEVAAKFKTLLSAGGSVHPATLYRNFRGQNPDPKALLRRAGLLKTETAV